MVAVFLRAGDDQGKGLHRAEARRRGQDETENAELVAAVAGGECSAWDADHVSGVPDASAVETVIYECEIAEPVNFEATWRDLSV